MPEAAAGVRERQGGTILLIGTMKGASLATAEPNRSGWSVDGPHFPEGHEDIRWSGGFGTRIPEGREVVVLPSVSGG